METLAGTRSSTLPPRLATSRTKRLETYREKPLRFLRYYIMAHYKLDSKKPLREDDIYEWLSAHQNETGITERPLAFLSELAECAKVRFLVRTSRPMLT